MMQPDLGPDPTVTTHLLLQAVVLSLNGSASTVLPSSSLSPAWNGPSNTVIWVQSLLYASLASSLFAALGALLAKQWLSHYRSVGERGSMETRCMERQRKFASLEAWHFRTVLEALPVLLQLSLLLFGLGLSAYMWSQQRTIALVLIIANGLGALFYFWIVGASLLSSDSPFHTPLSGAIMWWFGTVKTIPSYIISSVRPLPRRSDLAALVHHSISKVGFTVNICYHSICQQFRSLGRSVRRIGRESYLRSRTCRGTMRKLHRYYLTT